VVKQQSRAPFRQETQPNIGLWWENSLPNAHVSGAEFEPVTNTVLIEELELSLKENRFEIMELPGNVLHINNILNSGDDYDLREIAELVQDSPSLAGSFLSAANSASFSRGIKITNLNAALPRLGKEVIQGILFLNTARSAIPDHPLFAKVASDYIEESHAVARICRFLSQRFYGDDNRAYMAGLLHNVGALALLRQIALHYALPGKLDIPFSAGLFRDIVPRFESRAGGLVAHFWDLDADLASAIEYHMDINSFLAQDPPQNHRRLTALVRCARNSGKVLGLCDLREEPDLFNDSAAKIIGMRHYPDVEKVLVKLPAYLREQGMVLPGEAV
jgi:HD-like signal output (HDOD) protein